MNARQFLWGLSAGASALAVGGFFWSGVCGAALAARGWWAAWGIAATLQFGVSVVLLWAAVRLRRRSGFVRGDLMQTNPDQRQATRRMVKAFIWVVLGQLSTIALAIWWCVHTGRKDLVFPVIGLIVSLHFVPLGRIFHVRPYYLTGLAGSVLCLPVLFIPL